MRVEPFGVGSFVHVMKRGARGLPIVKTKAERLRFARLLYLLNDHHRDENWEKNTVKLAPFERPAHWPEQRPLVRIHAWVLLPNHFHLILEEICEGGIAKFMQRLCGSMSCHFNAVHGERGKGSIFQGGYKGKCIATDTHLRQVIPYVLVKNVFEMYPAGLQNAGRNFEKAWAWAMAYPYGSLGEYVGKSDFPITDQKMLKELFPKVQIFKKHAREALAISGQSKKILNKLSFE